MTDYKISSGLAISDNGFLFNSFTGETFTCNPFDVRILNEMKSEKNIDEIKLILLAEYDVDEDRLSNDINEFLAQLEINGLLEN